jgi:ABC-type ATPase involved in cell division
MDKMHLSGFKIQNFKSITSTDWCSLSQDNITGLIGQNESGKSSILEALYSFYIGDISEDFLRTDKTLPEISCSFRIQKKYFDTLFSGYEIPEEVSSFIEKEGRINITKRWKLHGKNYDMFLEETALRTAMGLSSEPLGVRFTQNETALALLVSTDVTASLPSSEVTALDPATSSVSTSNEPTAGITSPAIVTTIVSGVNKILTELDFLDVILKSIPRFEIFDDFGGLLPNTIDVDDIEKSNSSVEGYSGVQNLLTILEIDIETLKLNGIRMLENEIQALNKKITNGFKKFWRQKIGKSHRISIELQIKNYPIGHATKTAGDAYLVFWISDGQEKLYPKQRSKGVRWFLSFYLHLMASAKRNEKLGRVFLIDEPGGNLHATAQKDVLNVLEDLRDKIQVIYATHAPHLISLENLHRLIAVQRDVEDAESSTTKVLSVHKLGAASADTLSPIYTLMGADFSDQKIIRKSGNVIIEEISAFYYLSTFWKITGNRKKLSFLPATGVTNIPTFVNLFLGWGIEYIVVLDDESDSRKVYNELKKKLFFDDDEATKKKVYKIKGCHGIEDLFSVPDFKKFVLHDEELEIPEKNSKYMIDKELSKGLYAMKFMLKIKEEEIKLSDFDDETQTNISELMAQITAMLVIED